MILVDLFPGAHRWRWEYLERGLEHIEATDKPFSRPWLTDAIGRCPQGYGAANQIIDSLSALGLIERISPPNARPVYYAKTGKGGDA